MIGKSKTTPEGSNSQPKRKWNWTWLILIMLAVINIIGVGAWSFENYSRANPEFCTSCHLMQGHVNSYVQGTFMDNVHKRAGVGCKDCHSTYSYWDEVQSAIKYISGDYERVLSRRKVEDTMCLQCHVSMAYQAARTDFLTRNPHLSHWPELRCGSCHLSHDKQVDYCSRCHENGGQRMTGAPIVPRAHNPWADPNAKRPDVK